MKIENRLYTVAETAEVLRTGQARVREYVRDGILQSRRHGRRILILGISIARYLGITLDENGKENTREELSRT
jgi:Helix-turn-helix domain